MAENRKRISKIKYLGTPSSTKKRLIFALLASFLLVIVLIIRLFYWQFIRGDELSKMAIAQQTRDRTIDSKRGSILDRNNKPLAISAKVEMITVTPTNVQKSKVPVSEIAAKLADILKMDKATLEKKLSKNSMYEMIKRKVEKEDADKIRQYLKENDIGGFQFSEDAKRFYPYGNFAAQLIGFCGMDNQGLEGIEKKYDSVLKGSPGRVVSATNSTGGEMPFKYEKMVDAKNGLNVVLTIDETIQRIAEKHLEQALIENKLGNGAACIVMEVKTGDILAMVTKPDYDLNDPFTVPNEEYYKEDKKDSDEEKEESEEEKKKTKEEKENDEKQKMLAKMWRNKAVNDTYEPGSCFKVFTAAMALEEGVVSEDDTFVCNGVKHVDTYDIHCWRTVGHGSQTFRQAVQNSCNPAFMEIGARVGNKKFLEYLHGFGFYDKTGISLYGEATGLFHDPKNFNEVELATSSFGQGFTVTPLQMVTGVAGIVNGGKMMRPKIVKRYTDENGNVVTEMPDEVIRQIVSEQTSKELRSILESVVSEGGGSGAYIKGYRVGGKTGTSEKTPRGSGKYIASFMGIAPCDDPEIVCLVLLDEPRGDSYYGGIIAAPVARSIIEETLQYLNIEPAYTDAELATLETVVPNIVGLTAKEAERKIQSLGMKYKFYGEQDKIVRQLPKAGLKVNKNATIIGYKTKSNENTTTTVPQLTGLTVSQATALVEQANLNITVKGTGSTKNTNTLVSCKQDPLPGTVVEYGSSVVVEFKRTEAGE